MDLRNLINQYLRLRGSYPLAGNDSVIKLKINEETVIAFEESIENGYFFLFAVIDSLAQGREIDVLAEALSSNLFNRETGNASIGFDKDTKSFVLFQKISLNPMDEYQLQEIVSLFLVHLSYLKVKFDELNLLHKGIL